MPLLEEYGGVYTPDYKVSCQALYDKNGGFVITCGLEFKTIDSLQTRLDTRRTIKMKVLRNTCGVEFKTTDSLRTRLGMRRTMKMTFLRTPVELHSKLPTPCGLASARAVR